MNFGFMNLIFISIQYKMLIMKIKMMDQNMIDTKESQRVMVMSLINIIFRFNPPTTFTLILYFKKELQWCSYLGIYQK